MNKFADSNKLRKIFHLHSINVNRTKRFFKNVLAISSAFAVFLSNCPVYSVKAEAVGAFIIEGGTSDTDYTFEGTSGTDGVLTIISSTPMRIQNTDPNTPTTDRIEINSEANLTLNGVNINTNTGPAMKIQDEATFDVNITLADDSENTLISYEYYSAGLQKNSNVLSGTLTIDGNGVITATGGYGGTGIGGGRIDNRRDGSASNITISAGTVMATGGHGGAGIGGGIDASGSNITISGGEVTAIGDAAGIGSGNNGSASNITISGGTVMATGGYGSAGIGGGDQGSASNITISGGTVMATGGANGAGIGSGSLVSGNNITISGGEVTATGGYGAGIGGGYGGNGENITIAGGVVTAIGKRGAGIGGGYEYNGAGDGSNNILEGNAVLIAATEDPDKNVLQGFTFNSGIVFEIQGNSEDYTGTMYGDEVTITEDVTFPSNFTIEENKTLEIDNDVTLTIDKDTELTINDGAVIKNFGTLVENGIINCEGSGEVVTEVAYEANEEDIELETEYKTYRNSDGVMTYGDLPMPKSTRDGYKFSWFTDGSYSTEKEIDSNTPVFVNEHTLYGEWIKIDSEDNSDNNSGDENSNISMNYFESENETNKNDESSDFPGNNIVQEETYTISQIKVPEYLKSRIFVNSYPDGNFMPENSITRAEAAAMLYRLIYDGTQIDTNILKQYNDVEKDNWSTAAIAYLTQHGIMQDFDGEFRPDDKITRAEFVKIVYESLLRYNANKNSKLIYGENEFKFSDVKNDWTFEPIKQLATNEMINGYGNDLFKPEGNITRAEAVKIINKAFGRSENWIGSISFNDVSENHWAYKFIMNAANGE